MANLLTEKDRSPAGPDHDGIPDHPAHGEADARPSPSAAMLGHQVRLYRYIRGWGPSELARRANISRAALFRLEHGTTGLPRAVTIQRLAQAFNVSVDDLLNETGESSPVDDSPEAGHEPSDRPPGDETRDLERKFLELLQSPIGDWVARLVEETHRWLPAVRPYLPEVEAKAHPDDRDAPN